LGFKVLSFEPDPNTFNLHKELLIRNHIKFFVPDKFLLDNINEFFLSNDVVLVNAAVSNFDGVSKFKRFTDNPTGNHLEGRKHNIYGDVSEINVSVFDLSKFKFDAIIKIDAEGEDAQILGSILEAKKITGKFYLCDWRDETRLKILDLILTHKVNAFNPFINKKISLESDLPNSKSANFIILDVLPNKELVNK
jgi:hypothetical protein